MPLEMKAQLLDIFRRRHSCHQFDPTRSIPRDDLEFILEAGRLSPCSFGLEQWKFIVLSSPHDKLALQEACFQQPQVGTASCAVVILAKIAEMHPDSPYVQRLLAREYAGEKLAEALSNYRAFYAATDVTTWSVTQCHIAAANMMTAAAGIGIDSCAIGGFKPDEVSRLLALEPGRYAVALVLTLGYCTEAAGEKLRLPLAELVEYR